MWVIRHSAFTAKRNTLSTRERQPPSSAANGSRWNVLSISTVGRRSAECASPSRTGSPGRQNSPHHAFYENPLLPANSRIAAP